MLICYLYLNKSLALLVRHSLVVTNQTEKCTLDIFYRLANETTGDLKKTLWYADYLIEKMRKMLNAKFTKSELIYLLVMAEKRNGVVAPNAYWPRFFAKFLVNRYL